MKKLILFWILILFLLALPIAFADLQTGERDLILQNSSNETIFDGRVRGGGNADIVFNDVNLQSGFNDADQYRKTYIRFNETAILDFCGGVGSIVTSATIDLFVTTNEAAMTMGVYYVNASLNASVTHNTFPCGAPTGVGFECNATPDQNASLGATNNVWERFNVTPSIQEQVLNKGKNASFAILTTNTGTDQSHVWRSSDDTTNRDQRVYLNISECSVSTPDTTPPILSLYNMTSEGGAGCINWRTNKSNPCSTSDTTPTVEFTTDGPAWCVIGTQNINFTDYNALAINRNCTIGQGTTSHACTLTTNDELIYQDSNIHIGCKDSSGNENRTSSSGALSLTITGLEEGGDTAIGNGVQNALLSGYTNYTEQQIYARKPDNTQDVGRFDWFVKKGNKAWAFNYVTKGETHVQLFNLTPVLYVLEMSNITSANITNKVEAMINTTK